MGDGLPNDFIIGKFLLVWPEGQKKTRNLEVRTWSHLNERG